MRNYYKTDKDQKDGCHGKLKARKEVAKAGYYKSETWVQMAGWCYV